MFADDPKTTIDGRSGESIVPEFMDLDDIPLDSRADQVATPVEVSSSRLKSSESNSTSLADRLFRPLSLAKSAFLLGLAVLFPYLAQRLPQLSSRPEYRIEASQIQLVPEPVRPVPADLLEQVCRQANFPRELSVLDSKLSYKLAAAFSRNPWIEQVITVKQAYPASVIVEVKYRNPVAMVEVKGGRIPVDVQAVVLPTHDFSTTDVARYPTIRGIVTSAPTAEGAVWKDPALCAAARVAELLGPKWKDLELDAIEVPNHTIGLSNPDEVLLELQTRSGSRIIWGRAPGSDHPGELTSPQKLGRMEKYLSEFGGFDRPNGPYEIDIRHWQEITRRQLSKTQSASRNQMRTRR